MANKSIKRFINSLDFSGSLLKKGDSYRQFVCSVLNRYLSQSSQTDKVVSPVAEDASTLPTRMKLGRESLSRYNSDDDDNKWKSDLAWLTKAVEPALQLFRRALPVGNSSEIKTPPSSLSLAEILASIQRSKLGIQEWSLSDLTIGLYLIYLRQASTNSLEDVKGVQVSSEPLVQDLIYYLELAKGCYKDGAASLAKYTMLRGCDVLKFVKNSSVMRPGYYIGIDRRKKLVILGIRGTQTVYDLITDIVSTSHEEVTFEGYSSHFGTAEAARWFLTHEIGGTIKKCLDEHKGFRLRLVGHSLGAATVSLLAIMLKKKSQKELGFDPDIVHAVGYATPPCVSRELAESCSAYVTTVVMQDDIIPRLSVASMSVIEKEDWRSLAELVTNAKQVMCSVQDAARKVADFANFRSGTSFPEVPSENLPNVGSCDASISKPNAAEMKEEPATFSHAELFVPGTIYYLKRSHTSHSRDGDSNKTKSNGYFTLLKREPGDHFQNILLSGNLIFDHKCDSHYYALRDVIKGLPGPVGESIF
ncbi:Diacylglycerol lipase-beta-like protein [Drosera capensis]